MTLRCRRQTFGMKTVRRSNRLRRTLRMEVMYLDTVSDFEFNVFLYCVILLIVGPVPEPAFETLFMVAI